MKGIGDFPARREAFAGGEYVVYRFPDGSLVDERTVGRDVCDAWDEWLARSDRPILLDVMHKPDPDRSKQFYPAAARWDGAGPAWHDVGPPLHLGEVGRRARRLLEELPVYAVEVGRDGAATCPSKPLVPDSVLRATCYALAQDVVTLVQLIRQLDGRQ